MFQKVILILIMSLTVPISGYVQELILHEKADLDGNVFTFKSHVPDATLYSLGNVELICVRGAWRFFNQTNYVNWHRGFESAGPGLTCSEASSWWSDVQSFRHWAASETRVDAVSLYESYDLVGQEFYVDQFPIPSIPMAEVKTLTYTGTANFTVFDSPDYTGGSACLKPPDSMGHYNLIYNISSQLHLTTIASILKGCPAQGFSSQDSADNSP